MTTIFNIIEFPKGESGSKVIFPNRADFDKALKISIGLQRIGTPLRAVDILIASICINRGLPLATKDHDFEQIAKIERLNLRIV